MGIKVRTNQLAHSMDYNGPDEPCVVHDFPDGRSHKLNAIAGRPYVTVFDSDLKTLGEIIEPAAIIYSGGSKYNGNS